MPIRLTASCAHAEFAWRILSQALTTGTEYTTGEDEEDIRVRRMLSDDEQRMTVPLGVSAQVRHWRVRRVGKVRGEKRTTWDQNGSTSTGSSGTALASTSFRPPTYSLHPRALSSPPATYSLLLDAPQVCSSVQHGRESNSRRRSHVELKQRLLGMTPGDGEYEYVDEDLPAPRKDLRGAYVSEGLVERVRELNAMDVALHEGAMRLLEEQRRRLLEEGRLQGFPELSKEEKEGAMRAVGESAAWMRAETDKRMRGVEGEQHDEL